MKSLGIRNNNPLNIRFSKHVTWKGQSGVHRGFCKFETMKLGYRAALLLLCNYYNKGYDTIHKIINRWAPPSENDTPAYIRYVSFASGVNPYVRIPDFYTLAQIALVMSIHECGSGIVTPEYREAFDDAYTDFDYPELKK